MSGWDGEGGARGAGGGEDRRSPEDARPFGAGGDGAADARVLADVVEEGPVLGSDLVRARRRTDRVPLLLERSGAVVAAADEPGLSAAAARWRAVSSPHLLLPRAVVCELETTVVVLDGGPVRSVAALLDRRAALDPGEVVTVGVAVARAVAAAHAHGLRVGALAASRVLLASDGMPVLAVGEAALRACAADGTRGVERTVGPAVGSGSDDGGPAAGGTAGRGDRPDADVATGRAQDIAAVADLCAGLLGPRPPAALADPLDRAAALDPGQRPDARTLAVQLQAACAAEPVRWGAADEEQALPAGTTDRPRVPAAAAAGLLVLVLAGAGAGWASGRGAEQPAAQVQDPGWSAVLDRLDTARATAFARADERALEQVYAPQAPALVQDRRQVRALVGAGHTAHGVRHRVRAVEVLAQGRRQARLRVVDVLQPYEVRDADGSVVGEAPGRGAAAHLVELSRTPDGWRLVEVERVPG